MPVRVVRVVLFSIILLVNPHAFATATWTEEEVSTGTPMSEFTANLLRSGEVAVSYINYIGNNIQQGVLTTQGWEITPENLPMGITSRQIKSFNIDNDGFAHLIYLHSVADVLQLWYATNKPGDWHTEVIIDNLSQYHTDAQNIYAIQMVIDPANHIHLTIPGQTDKLTQVLYISNSAGSWRMDTIYSKPITYNLPIFYERQTLTASLAVDQEGYAHIAYAVIQVFGIEALWWKNPGSIFYATNRTGGWKSQLADRIDNIFEVDASVPIIAVNDKGHAYLFYTTTDQENSELIYATNSFGFWQKSSIEKFSSELGKVTFHGIVVKDNVRHITYEKRSGNSSELIYAQKQPRKDWTKQVLKTDPSVANANTIAPGSGANYDYQLLLLDTNQSPHILTIKDQSLMHGYFK